MSSQETYFRRGLGLKDEVQPILRSEYGSALVSLIQARGNRLEVGRLRFRLADSFGFCYGVDRAVEYAYETRRKFPDRRIYLVGEIIHNPHVNRQLREMGIEFLYPDPKGRFDFDAVGPEDVVILPAFGVGIEDFERLRDMECVVVDTTCGSVLLVWKRVESYARDGFTAIIHGKHYHEETRATSSQVRKHEGGQYLVVRDMDEAELVCDYIRGRGDRASFMERFRGKHSDGFDPDRDLERVGVANQTTMVASESLAIADRVHGAMRDRYGREEAAERFRSFDTICSATQDRQDAVVKMMAEPPDLMVVIGGYNSSNTNHLAHLCSQSVRTFHIEDAACIDPAAGTIDHKEIMGQEQYSTAGWLPEGEVEIGLTAGASTPNSKIGETVERILRQAGYDPDAVLEEASEAAS
ncbi:MAG TPA: 4-hydroxy-3-methylbut-2-enyl diphosphate reductase [Gemmatimonadota bacterium]|nr:4-hydroxy-3-methylbut-2-enyl diphosphate reductase [Gemmatimonadota bacterium]